MSCANCFGMYAEGALRLHFNHCSNNSLPGERIAKELGRAVEGRSHAEASDELRTVIFPSMRGNQDEVLAIRYDWLIILHGNDLCMNTTLHRQHQIIRDELRKAGKLLLGCRSRCSEITDFSSIYEIRHCNLVVEVIRSIGKFDPVAKLYGAPSTAASLITLINNIGKLLIIEWMKRDEREKESSVQRFLTVFQKDIKNKISKLVRVTQIKIKREKKENLPKTDDIRMLADYLDSERDSAFIQLKQMCSAKIWLKLAELTLMSIIVLNRKRVGDAETVILTDFQNREIIDEHTDPSILADIPEEVRELIKSRMSVRGKLYRTVPILLTKQNDECIDLLIHHRKQANVPNKNEYVFAKPSKSEKISAINACALFRKYSEECGTDNPTSLRSTKLRIHFASLVGEEDLKDSQVSLVAGFMGHDDDVHRNIYRRKTLQGQVTQMTKLLLAAQGRKMVDTGAENVIQLKRDAATRKLKMQQKTAITNKTTGFDNAVPPSGHDATTRKRKTQRKTTITNKKRRIGLDNCSAARGSSSTETGPNNAVPTSRRDAENRKRKILAETTTLNKKKRNGLDNCSAAQGSSNIADTNANNAVLPTRCGAPTRKIKIQQNTVDDKKRRNTSDYRSGALF